MTRRLRAAELRPWLIPLLYTAVAVTAGLTLPRASNTLLPHLASTISTDAAIGIYSSIASGMIALTGIVFSLGLVMSQFSATAYSPRLVLWIARDPVISHALGIFAATFLYALAALAWVDRNHQSRVPLTSFYLVAILLFASIAILIALVHQTGRLQVNRMLIFTGDRGREIIAGLYPLVETTVMSPVDAEFKNMAQTQVLCHDGRPRIVQAVDISALVEIASQTGCVIEMVAAVGDTVLDSTPILRVLGATESLSTRRLRHAIALGSDRTFEQDAKYAIRLLVDIAIKALSPAINDPTTAVQALDQIEDLLLRLGIRRLEIGAFRDSGGKVRVVVPFPSWDDFLRLAFDEIRFYGATSIQVMRCMKALVSELIVVLPQERHAALRYWHERLESTVDRAFGDARDKLDASTEDRQGLGITRQDRTRREQMQ
ncbi:MAG TPA: DUF2254 domain-containing protein [Candidatus Sulfotelmatobacter sp.]|nr:DUF2254 domain-containing protein [Candidatus Sulfotelmatobacter sp.]